MKQPQIVPDLILPFKTWDVRFRIAQYSNNGRIAIELIDAEASYSVIAKITINQPLEFKPDKYWVDIKNYSENFGMVDWLLWNEIIAEKRMLSMGIGVRCLIIEPNIKAVMDEFYDAK